MEAFSTNLKFKTPPRDDEIELSLFGPGYGECILIHMGNQEWIIIDSCVFRGQKKPAALFYFDEIGKNISKCVKLIVATHWDDDHIKGISQSVHDCPSAEFCQSGALKNTKFTTLVVDAPTSLVPTQKTPTGLSQVSAVYSILFDRQITPIYASNDKTIWKSRINPENEIISLSPHDSMFHKAISSIISQLPGKLSSSGKIKPPTPNATSVVLYCKIGDTRILLGADLEESAENKGWSLIIDENKSIDAKATVFKVPHHGSENGDHPKIWTDLLEDEPICILAPWNKSSKLPTAQDIGRLKTKSPFVYLTSDPKRSVNLKVSDGFLRRKLKEKKVKYNLSEMGLVRLRKTFNSTQWSTECFGLAKQI